MKFLKDIPYIVLIPVALLMGLAPFNPEPHLTEKLRLLLGGILTRPVDIFDLLMHGAPVLLLVVKFAVERRKS
jgi:hypothetical protein